MRKYWVLLSAVMVSLCIGATYAWSVFVAPLKQLTGLDQGGVQLPFTVFYICFPVTLMFSGVLMARIGPRLTAALGGLVFGGGWCFASFGQFGFVYTILGIGVLGGVGVGLAYVVPISTGVRWFPSRKGLVIGVAVAGFGSGAILVANLSKWLMTAHQWTPFDLFRGFGLGFMALIALASLGIANPSGTAAAHRPAAVRGVLAEGGFRMLYFGMFAGLIAGFTAVTNIKEFYRGENALGVGILAVSMFAISNAVGRLLWGWLFDRVSSQAAVRANLCAQGLTFLAAPWLITSASGVKVFAILAGLNYGGVLVIYASAAARRWGGERVGQVYGWIFTANIPASLAPVLAGKVFAWTGSFTLPLVASALVLMAAAAWVRLVDETRPS